MPLAETIAPEAKAPEAIRRELRVPAALPARRRDLVFKPIGDEGDHVIKDPKTGAYFRLGPQESFLFARFDGHHTRQSLAEAYHRRFDEDLGDEDLDGFLQIAEESGFFTPAADRPTAPTVVTSPAASPTPQPKKSGQSLLSWRKSVFDPDRLFNRLEPKLRWVWTRGFLLLSAGTILSAVLVSWLNRQELVTSFPGMLRWETLLLAWVTLVLATTMHEFAHGLTCKHYGGEVHEVGFLMLFFIPCLYCNVSDAWLFREKSKRLWVTLAGGYCDLCLWACAVLLWRFTAPDTLPNYLAWVLMGVGGVRSFFNFNPLLKLDGYYLLSDATDMPNLRSRALGRFMAYLRWMLWGGARPAAEQRGTFLLTFGLATWGYSVLFLGLMVLAFVHWWGGNWGTPGAVAAVALGVVSGRGMFYGFSNGEVTNMFTKRKGRAAVWGLALLGLAAAGAVVPMSDRAGGPFKLRAASRAELRAPVAGFLREVHFAEGEAVGAGSVVLRLEVPDVRSRVSQKHAEVGQAEATLAKLMSAPGAGRSGSAAADAASIQYWEIREAEGQLRRAREELRYLMDVYDKQPVASPVAGMLVTPRLTEKVGQFFKEGELICEVEDPSYLEAEIAVPEQEMARVRPGCTVELKARVAAFDTLRSEVTRVAAGATAASTPSLQQGLAAGAAAPPSIGDVPGRVVVNCTLGPSAAAAGVRPGMTGYARIDCGRRPAAQVIGARLMRYVRTEFWW